MKDIIPNINDKTSTNQAGNEGGSDGKVNINIPELSNGNYQYIISYSGDDKYSSFTMAGNLKVLEDYLKIILNNFYAHVKMLSI